MILRAAIAPIMAFALLAGCSNRKSYEGSWQGRRPMQAVEGADPAIIGTLARVKLTIRPTDRFLLIDGGVPKEGEIQYGGDGPYLSIDTFVGRSVAPEKRVRLKIVRVGEVLRLSLPDGDLDLKPSGFSDRNGK
ncbi:hypothetical protein EON81_07135 [bacterium]|nr:MAG: hypothetical protein EON81_07135 [bacterium]